VSDRQAASEAAARRVEEAERGRRRVEEERKHAQAAQAKHAREQLAADIAAQGREERKR
jgi:hypothetical protein